MSELNVPPMLWLVGFQMALYALAWALFGALLKEERAPAVHWGAFLLLCGVVMLLAGARGEPRHWLFYNGANVVSLVAFALMRRGTERFVHLPSSDREQLVVLLLLCGAVAAVGPSEARASWRVVLSYGGQAYLLLRTIVASWRPLRAEFGRGTSFAIGIPGLLIGAMLATLSIRQALDFAHPVEMQRNTGASYALMYYYLGGVALFNFGFMVMLTQRLVLKLREASRQDPLTTLMNRRALDEALQRQWRGFVRHRRAFAVLLVDIDHFKRINDSHGHAAGDAVLVGVAAQLSHHARATDAVGRFGGEEFLLLLADVDAAEALRSAERLRQRVADRPLVAEGLALPVRVSIGVALADDGDADVDAVVARADRALYRAKAAGRNRCEFGALEAAS